MENHPMWPILAVGLFFLVGCILGFYLGWSAHRDEKLHRDDGPAG
jgi:hypothetical protein